MYNYYSMMKPIEIRYVEPTTKSVANGVTIVKKQASKFTDEEKEDFEKEMKAYATITMVLNTDIRHSFRRLKTSKDSWMQWC